MNKKELLYLSIGIFLTVLAWLVSDIRHASTEEKIKVKTKIPVLKQYEINENVLKVLKNKEE